MGVKYGMYQMVVRSYGWYPVGSYLDDCRLVPFHSIKQNQNFVRNDNICTGNGPLVRNQAPVE
jgi:hypothetical protein